MRFSIDLEECPLVDISLIKPARPPMPPFNPAWFGLTGVGNRELSVGGGYARHKLFAYQATSNPYEMRVSVCWRATRNWDEVEAVIVCTSRDTPVGLIPSTATGRLVEPYRVCRGETLELTIAYSLHEIAVVQMQIDKSF